EAQLRRQALVFENISDAVIITDMQGCVIDWNPAAERIYGYLKAEVLGTPLRLDKFTRDGADLSHRIATALKQDGRWQGEVTILRKDGAERLMEAVSVPLFDAQGSMIAVISMNRDVTERKRAEAENIHKSDTLAKFSDNLKTLHRITLMNYDNVEGMFGDYLLAGCEILGLPLGILGEVRDETYIIWRVFSVDDQYPVHPGDRYTLSDTYCADTVREWRTLTYTHVGSMLDMREHPQYLSLGTETYIGSPIFVHGAVYGTLIFSSTEPRAKAFTAAEIEIIELMALGIGRSIELSLLEKERERAESALREANGTFEALIEASPLAIVVFNSEGIVDLWNPAAERIFGWRAEEAIGKPPVYVQSEKMDEFNQLLTTILSGKSLSNLELRRQRSDSSLIDISISSAPMRGADGRIRGIMSVIDDVTERKKAKQQELELVLERERVRLIADFVRDASHDFRTPLSNIRTSAYLLERSTDAEQRRRRVNTIDEQVTQIDQLVDSLLTITRLNSGVEFTFRQIDLNETLQQVMVKMRPSAERKNLTLALELRDVSPVTADESYMYQALVNLTQNAVDYTDDDGQITIRTFNEDEYVVVEISDTGVGISADDLPFILDRVYRTDRSWSAVGRPGLGLPIAKKIIEGHKGHIEVSSTPKQGSQFRVYVPAVPEVVRPN
ncbi:MAG: PAS domain S-box protein, partial [Burkholderiales bacterium]|nr:PAS domain S-box protein [Anaerolineae bacterium]